MGVSHLTPNGTTALHRDLIDYKGKHSDISDIDERYRMERLETDFIMSICDKTGLYALPETKWVSDNQKVVAETYHGLQLRLLYHPSAPTVYAFITCVTMEGQVHNLGLQDLEKYHDVMVEEMERHFGNVRRKTTAWTSETVDV